MHRIGLLGASKIARGAVIAPAKNNPDFEVVAVGARDAARARAYADEHGIPHVAGSYAELVARDDVDVVYNALPPAGHAEWTIAALGAGKAVLCEKPFAMNADEARAMTAAATIALASPAFIAKGFSQSTVLPASSAAMVHSACPEGGRAL